MLSTVQIGITLVGIVAGAFGGARLAEPLDDALARMPGLAPFSAEIAYTLVIAAITYLSLIVGELVPKHLALRAPERVAARGGADHRSDLAHQHAGGLAARGARAGSCCACWAARSSRPRR